MRNEKKKEKKQPQTSFLAFLKSEVYLLETPVLGNNNDAVVLLLDLSNSLTRENEILKDELRGGDFLLVRRSRDNCLWETYIWTFMEVWEITFSVTVVQSKEEVCIRLKQRRAKYIKQIYLTFTFLFWSQNLEKPSQLISKQTASLLAAFLPLNGKSHRRDTVYPGIKFMIRSYFMSVILPWDFHV